MFLIRFLQKLYQDPSLLEFAWAELLENSKSITVETLVEEEVYFSVLERHGFHFVYAPRSTDQDTDIMKCDHIIQLSHKCQPLMPPLAHPMCTMLASITTASQPKLPNPRFQAQNGRTTVFSHPHPRNVLSFCCLVNESEL